VATDCAFKLIDFLRQPQLWNRATWRELILFLVPFPVLLIVYAKHRRRLMAADPALPHLLRIILGTAIFVVALALIPALERSPAIRGSSIVIHIVRLAVFIPAIEAISQVLYGIERLMRFDTRPIVHRAYLASTVTEFWRRYNYRVHDWLFRHVFQPAGGCKRPAPAILLVFAVSGLFHEAMFAIATSQLTGYQFAFFAIQGPAALASRYFETLIHRHKLVGLLVAHTSTILFLSATSILFFDGVSKVFSNILTAGSPLP
jgi:hypothetical protein